MALDLGGVFSSFGTGIGDFISAAGDEKNAEALDAAAGLEDINARLAGASKDIQHSAAQRDIFKVLGGQASDIGHAGFQMSGSALDLARDSAQQGAITQGLIEIQGNIEIQNHIIAAANLRAQAEAARNAAKSARFGGVMSIIGGIFGLFSDERLKENLVPLGRGKNGLMRYSYNYIADPNKEKWVGYLAQDVEQVDPSAVLDMGLKFIDSEYAPEKVNG